MNWRYCDILYNVTMMRHLTLLLLILFVKTRITVELTWNTEKVSYACCQSKSELLIWNFTEAENERVMELQWFFNETTLICLDSKTIGFHVETLYVGRVERNAKAGILLNNVSLNDAGKYTLYVKLAEEKIRNVQHLTLTVFDQVPNHCKPIIEIHPPNVIYCSTSCFESSQLSAEWILNGLQDPVGIGRYLTINARINEDVFCCLRGLKCYDDDELKLCMPNPIPIPSKDCTFENVHTREQFEITTVKGTDYEGTETSDQMVIMWIIVTGVIMNFILVASVVAYFGWRRRKSQTIQETTSDLEDSKPEKIGDASLSNDHCFEGVQ